MKTRMNRKKSRRLWLKIPLALIAVFMLVVGGYGVYLYQHAKKTVNTKMHEPVPSIDVEVVKKKVKATEPLNILLLGIDAESTHKGRSDALMVLTLNPAEDAMQLISIPRDTRTTIATRGTEDKINHAYAFGGADMSVATVENFLNIDLDYYVSINMEGFKELVDELGTITVQNDLEWKSGKYHFTKGPVQMDSDKTMAFVRMRKQDPAGDFGRTKRQRQVIQGIIDRGATIGSITKIDRLIHILGNNIQTNMDFADMKRLFTSYASSRKNMTDYQVKGTGTKINGTYYLIVPEEEVAKVHHMIADIEA